MPQISVLDGILHFWLNIYVYFQMWLVILFTISCYQIWGFISIMTQVFLYMEISTVPINYNFQIKLKKNLRVFKSLQNTTIVPNHWGYPKLDLLNWY